MALVFRSIKAGMLLARLAVLIQLTYHVGRLTANIKVARPASPAVIVGHNGE